MNPADNTEEMGAAREPWYVRGTPTLPLLQCFGHTRRQQPCIEAVKDDEMDQDIVFPSSS